MKTAIVTGASKGIGKAIALKLASLKYAMVLVARNTEQLAQLKQLVESHGVPCLTLAVDLSKEETPKNIIQQTIAHFGGIDVLINNAIVVVSVCNVTCNYYYM